jgi:hypothetical protein
VLVPEISLTKFSLGFWAHLTPNTPLTAKSVVVQSGPQRLPIGDVPNLCLWEVISILVDFKKDGFGSHSLGFE